MEKFLFLFAFFAGSAFAVSPPIGASHATQKEAALPLQVAEGLHNANPPEVLRKCWNASFALARGTGTLVKTVRVDADTTDAYFLTAHHVYQSVLNQTAQDNKRLLKQGQHAIDPKSMVPIFFEMRDTSRGGTGMRYNPVAYEAADVISERASDLALVKVRLKREQDDNFEEKTRRLSSTAIPEMGKCENLRRDSEVYAVGYPDTALRPANAQRQPIAEPYVIQKRWSYGAYMDRELKLGASMKMVTADALPGNSGGPACDGNGRLIGVVSALDVTKGLGYSGKTYMTSCQDTRRFLDKHLPKTTATPPPVVQDPAPDQSDAI